MKLENNVCSGCLCFNSIQFYSKYFTGPQGTVSGMLGSCTQTQTSQGIYTVFQLWYIAHTDFHSHGNTQLFLCSGIAQLVLNNTKTQLPNMSCHVGGSDSKTKRLFKEVLNARHNRL